MSRSICCLGDGTDHHGTVKRVSGTLNIDGRRNARKGDVVSCPTHGDNPIIEGEASMQDEGVPIVLHGHRSECGSVIIASANVDVST